MTSTYGEASDLALTLDAVVAFVRRYVVLSDAQLVAISLWVFHTHAFEAADVTPYLHVSSPLKRCGKSLLLNKVLRPLVREPLLSVNISDAAMFRAIADLSPTLLFDEIDAIFGPKARDREDLRGMLNAGFERGAQTLRMGGKNNRTLEAFPVYCPKAFAGIGDLPDTVADRTVRIRLERRTRDEPIERFRRRNVAAAVEPIRQSLESLADHHLQTLTYARPDLPEELDDRAQDVWEPLLAIADLASGDWPERARSAAVTLSSDDEREDDSHGVRLLADIRDVFDVNDARRYKTSDLIAELAKVEESPWGDWFGKAISPQALGKLLKPYRIKTMPVWVDAETHRGYKREQFDDAWSRVLGVRSVRGVSPGSSTDAAPNAPNAPNALVVEAHEVNARPVGDLRGEARIAKDVDGAGILVVGDDGYVDVLAAASLAGQITDTEGEERLALHRSVRASLDATDGDLALDDPPPRGDDEVPW